LAFSRFLGTPHLTFVRKGIPMASLRSFISTYSPMFAVSAAIVALYAMAIAIGCGLGRTI
jgi:ABC-type multidrug transport system permease subunit